VSPLRRYGPALLALIPFAALSLAIPFVNRLEPRVGGLPFLLAWIVLWMILTPVFLSLTHRAEGRP
jgi:hypothetical protein